MTGNTEICEQLFRGTNKFKFTMRGMNEARFNACMLSIVEHNHREVSRKQKEKAARVSSAAAALSRANVRV
jgi:hypothetical protein